LTGTLNGIAFNQPPPGGTTPAGVGGGDLGERVDSATRLAVPVPGTPPLGSPDSLGVALADPAAGAGLGAIAPAAGSDDPTGDPALAWWDVPEDPNSPYSKRGVHEYSNRLLVTAGKPATP